MNTLKTLILQVHKHDILLCLCFHQYLSTMSYSGQFSSVAQWCPTLCDPMNCSTPGLLSITSSMSSSNCCFLTCIQISQEAGQVVWYSHLFKNFPVYCDPHSQGFGIVKKAEVDVFLELSCFFYDPANVGNLISGSSAFSKTSLNIWKLTVHVLLKPDLKNFEHYFPSM